MRLAQEEMGNDATRTAMLAYVYAISGRQAEARGLLAQLWIAAHRSARSLALVYIGLGDKDKAFELLRQAVAESHGGVLLKLSPVYNSLRSDQRFANLLSMMGLQ